MDSTIAAGLIAGGTAIGTLLANELFQLLRRRDEIKERFFYELYGRRIACHERLLRIAAEYSPYYVPAGPLGLYRRSIKEFMKVFQGELVACQMFADKKVLSAASKLKEIVDTVFSEQLKSGRLKGDDKKLLGFHDSLNYTIEIARAYNQFMEVARATAGTKAMEAYLKRIEKIQKAPIKKAADKRYDDSVTEGHANRPPD